MRRFLFLSHRYLGIGIGLIMAMWCLSGFVMMYVPYPSVSQQQLLASSAPLDFSRCCDSSAMAGLGLVDVNRFTVEMLGERPVVRLRASGSRNPMLDLQSGALLEGISPEQAERVAASFARHAEIAGEIGAARQVTLDQWTVTAYYDYHRPLYHFAARDPQGSEWYVSSRSGELVQFSTRSQRFWNWLGAVPHWLYPTALRQHDGFWAQLVIALSLAGVFLTVLGLYIGIIQFRTLRSGRKSPYRGMALWHHYSGLLFGLLILTWVGSGLFSMNPWGLFDLSGGQAERQRLQGVPLFSDEVEAFLARLPQAQLPADSVRIEGYALLGKLYFVVYQSDGQARRYDGNSLQPAPIDAAEWQRLSAAARGRSKIAGQEMLNEEDAYYYSLKAERQLPVYRILLDNEDQTRLYLNARSGELEAQFDRQKRLYRWLFSGLHQLDLTALIRSRPLWDLIMWILLLGVSLGTVSGAYLGIRRLLR